MNAHARRLRVCRDPCPTELVTPVSPTSIESSDVLPGKEGAFQRLGEVEVLNPTVGTANGLAVVREEVKPLFRVNYKLRAGGALQKSWVLKLLQEFKICEGNSNLKWQTEHKQVQVEFLLN